MKVVGSGRRAAAVVVAAVFPAFVGAPLAGAEPPEERRYIVVLRPQAGDPRAVAAEHARRHGARVHHVYRHALNGYAATFRGNAASEAASDRRVAHIEPDGEVSASATTQTGATWGLDRIDQRALPLSGTFTYTNTGTGVTAYVIDTGIRRSHGQFAQRAVTGYDAVSPGGPADDCNGHGTHVAGTVGGTTYGVAKRARLVAVRVLGCLGLGSTSAVIAGVDWVTGDHDAGEPAVANMSLGGGASTALDTAVRNSIRDGVSYSVAAGNGNILGLAQKACNSSPARVAEAMTISATDKADRKASWANYGSCVDLFAPGVGITSAWHSSDTATNTISGTSMAAPHAAGVAALYLESNPAASPTQVRDALFAASSKGKVASSSTANNHLLFTSF